jgi:polyisoprenyl-teichoic acid--peptidoglycan teichoic acid transferase
MANRAPRSIYDQYREGPARARRRLPRWAMLLLLAPLTLLVAAGVYVGSVFLATRQAMGEVFVPSVRATHAPVAASAPQPTVAPGSEAVAPPQPTAAPGEAAPTPAPAIAPAAPAIAPEWQGADRLNVLLLGVDKREGEDVPRSDTMILVSIDPAGRRVGMLSIPRDLMVTIPGYGRDKINAAFPLAERDKLPGGGPTLAMETVQANFKVPVHHFATVDFRGFTRIIDAVGGVTVEAPYALKDDEYPSDEGANYTRLYVPAGLQQMDGTTALRYARSRHFDTDFGRNRRQQQVLQAIREQGLKLNLLPRLPEMITLLSGSVRTDLDPRQLPSLARLGMSIDREQIKSFGMTVDMTIVYDTPTDFHLEPNWPKINAALREMMGGAPAAGATAAARPAAQPTPRPVVTSRPAEPSPATKPAPTSAPAAATPRATSTATVAPTTTPAKVRVWVRNGTRVQGLAARNADILKGRGYTIVDVSQDPNAGQYPRSVIYLYGGERGDAIVLSQALGLPASAVKLGPAPAPAGTDILVILGEDAAR